VAGVAADDIGLQCGGWTVGWQGGLGRTTPGTTLLDGLRSAFGGEVLFDPAGDFGADTRTGVVCIAELPYAEGPGDSATVTARDEDRAVFSRMRERCDHVVLVIYSGRPLAISDLIEQADAVVAAWLPGSEAGSLAELLTGTHEFEAVTPQPWPSSIEDLDAPSTAPLYPTGHGLTMAPHDRSDGRALR
jgi:beta-glucosidase